MSCHACGHGRSGDLDSGDLRRRLAVVDVEELQRAGVGNPIERIVGRDDAVERVTHSGRTTALLAAILVEHYAAIESLAAFTRIPSNPEVEEAPLGLRKQPRRAAHFDLDKFAFLSAEPPDRNQPAPADKAQPLDARLHTRKDGRKVRARTGELPAHFGSVEYYRRAASVFFCSLRKCRCT